MKSAPSASSTASAAANGHQHRAPHGAHRRQRDGLVHGHHHVEAQLLRHPRGAHPAGPGVATPEAARRLAAPAAQLGPDSAGSSVRQPPRGLGAGQDAPAAVHQIDAPRRPGPARRAAASSSLKTISASTKEASSPAPSLIATATAACPLRACAYTRPSAACPLPRAAATARARPARALVPADARSPGARRRPAA